MQSAEKQPFGEQPNGFFRIFAAELYNNQEN
jgi:hypothetical protein